MKKKRGYGLKMKERKTRYDKKSGNAHKGHKRKGRSSWQVY
jgi:hypothetical protein